jgi:CheY-like chemotaxis protein/HPt (histidine-containing phosphotransfer) domain-containing protein/anti-sigma regulatory factor (Ser/Thr protein kinase)
MSHEIRTPMNAIMGMANQLDKTRLDHKQQFFLDTILGAADNLLVIINDILDLSKIEAGKLTLEKIGFELRAVVEHSFQMLAQKATEKGLQLHIARYDEDISRVLIGDPYRINQILLNLVGNAIKFTEKGSVEVSCELTDRSESTQAIRIHVTDTGIGMDQDFIEHLFDKFEQEDASITRQYGGTGLGMSICKQLIELMGGTIKVKSTKGVGTTITFQIEFVKGTQENIPTRDTVHVDATLLKGKRILVVDDNEMNRIVAITILSNYQAVTLEAANGREALDLLAKENPDLVLMDVQMPIMDGIEATRLIRKNISTAIPIIALTANAIKGDNDKCIDAGMNDYISKPFKEEELVKSITHWLGNPDWTPTIPEREALPTELPYDLTGIRNISRGNDAFVVKLVKLFIDQTLPIVSEIMEKYEAGDHPTMGALAHKLKPSIDNMGIINLKETIREIEKAGKSNVGIEKLPAHLHQLDSVMVQVVDALKHEFNL